MKNISRLQIYFELFILHWFRIGSEFCLNLKSKALNGLIVFQIGQ